MAAPALCIPVLGRQACLASHRATLPVSRATPSGSNWRSSQLITLIWALQFFVLPFLSYWNIYTKLFLKNFPWLQWTSFTLREKSFPNGRPGRALASEVFFLQNDTNNTPSTYESLRKVWYLWGSRQSS